MLNLNKFCSLFIGLILSVVCALPLSARDINVRGTVTNIEGEPLFRVSIYNAGTNKLIGSTNEDEKIFGENRFGRRVIVYIVGI